jgi:hypothetical protein
VIPLALSLLWGRFLMAGVISCVTLAVLLHVTVGLAAISLAYQGLERIARRAPLTARALAIAVAVASLALFASLSFG